MSPVPIPAASDDIATILQAVTPPTMPPHRSHDPSNNMKRSDPFQFGSRYLEQGDDVFEFNAWDHVEPDDEFKAFAEEQYAKQRDAPVSEFDRNRFNADPAKWWNLFYKNNTSNFFKNRKWLRQEFPILDEVTRAGAGKQVVLEVGAGAGNTAFPLLENNENEELMVHACDFSKTAVQVIRDSPQYNTKHITADVWDVSATGEESLPPNVAEGSVDVVVLIFIFSALAPNQWEQAIRNIYRVLKPGGKILFRDYGRGDLAQVRFKKGRYMGENFYIRGDGTRVYFFDRDELEKMWGQWTPEKGLPEGLVAEATAKDETAITEEATVSEQSGAFEVMKLAVDNRLIVNRQRKIKMYRSWIQGHFVKTDHVAAAASEKQES
ncbi:tRNA(Thr) (cytosine(32)-N(3))-methyltransferase [Aspergillus saccharolyticus JOP 1030-1]|uniref:tRNA N(3)-methylcytidine methyltransferase n=1 Tax=Aspergillus saccharolyticus JOP 1030-1 TaxID=1450539 RepID=A0A318ZT66_9EURO|nr:methyltransferase [Aspergillus saccharolyticus JOP 1030-1]PYH49844.1 methyltransferase [Aspergillus saccharolyticus JOP 1030-1]